MSGIDFDHFFRKAFGKNDEVTFCPFEYQRRLACGERAERSDRDWLASGTDCKSRLIDIPTGLGKTAAVVLAWLWNRVENKRSDWPRRLVYCLPVRTLVEQTRDNVHQWLKNLERARDVEVHILMGGEQKTDWDIFPEREAILIGTQDMLLSRALNRGYGMSRYRWPMHFGLLNNDALWIFDEVQLMGSGLPTTAQLEAFRCKLKSIGPCRSWWMSATSERGWLKTVDFDPESLGAALRLPDEDLVPDKGGKILDAPKRLGRAAATSTNLKDLAKEIVEAVESSNGLTLAVVNTVKRARRLFVEVEKLTRKAPLKPLLLHSRFRPDDRAAILRQVLDSEGKQRIVVSTQVIEAGVDLSAATLFTELAPWSSLVQRFGRCNRRGTIAEAKVYWFESANPAPYTEEQLKEAHLRLSDPALTDVSPNHVRSVPIPAVDRPAASHVIRRKDLIELFDTTPDLAGNDLDIDRWVREVEDSSVQIAWRAWEGRNPGTENRPPVRPELCPASLTEFRDFVKKTNSPIWRWDYLEGEWMLVRPDDSYPGQSYLLPTAVGGYSPETGWNPESKEPVLPVSAAVGKSTDESADDEALSEMNAWQSIAHHTDDVCEALEAILSQVPADQAALLRHAARWHDWGKAHPAFQAKLRPDSTLEREMHLGSEPAAKGPKAAWLPAKLGKKPREGEKRRKFFRHELASALGVLHPETPISISGEERDLVAYLIAAHHGKVRLSIRSLPGEWNPLDARRFARGVWDADPLPQTFLGGRSETETVAPDCELSLEPMELGLGEKPPFTSLPSWSERMLALREALGPFRLAFLETLLRAADERASALASRPALAKGEGHESPRTNRALAGTPAGGADSAAHAASAGEHLLEHVDGRGAGESRVAEGDTRPAGVTRTIETTRGELTYAEVAELLAARISELQPAIAAGAYQYHPLDESLLAIFHREICGELVPAWAGKWRVKAVTVGAHEPPAFHQISTLLRDYAADLDARWEFLSGDDENLLIETLAFAEGRFLFIHPFEDFNGRVARLWLREILRRAGLPEVRVEVRNAEERAAYYAALHAADQHDFDPLKGIWRHRFAEAI